MFLHCHDLGGPSGLAARSAWVLSALKTKITSGPSANSASKVRITYVGSPAPRRVPAFSWPATVAPGRGDGASRTIMRPSPAGGAARGSRTPPCADQCHDHAHCGGVARLVGLQTGPVEQCRHHVRRPGWPPCRQDEDVVEGQERPDDGHQDEKDEGWSNARDGDPAELLEGPGSVQVCRLVESGVDALHRGQEDDDEEAPPGPVVDERDGRKRPELVPKKLMPTYFPRPVSMPTRSDQMEAVMMLAIV